MARAARKNTMMGNTQRNNDKEFPATPKRRLGKAVVKNQKKYNTRVGTGSISDMRANVKEKASRPAYAETAASVAAEKKKRKKWQNQS